jgi:hypothetical protein
MSCQICLEDYKGKKIVKITCQYCPSNACRGCLQRYMLQSYEDPHCMDCKRGWSSEFMAANFPLVFRNDVLRKHRRKILLEREKATLPAMQIFVEYKRNMAKHEAEMNTIRATFGDNYSRRDVTPEMKKTTSYRYTMMRGERTQLAYRLQKVGAEMAHLKLTMSVGIESEYEGQELTDVLKAEIQAKKTEAHARSLELQGLRVQRMALKAKYEEMNEPFKALEAEYVDQRDLLNAATTNLWRNRRLYDGVESAAQRREFIMKCADEGCRGFLSSAYKCGTCEKWTCSQCLVVVGADKDAEHTCDPNTVETAKAIKADTRPCPKCGTRIFKIDGCDQMWCVMEGCGTAFSWTTGQIATGKVHNPHYYEWLRRTGGGTAPREPGDIPCGGLPAIYELLDCMQGGSNDSALVETHRNINELINYRLAQYPSRREQLANKDIDVEYLTQIISTETWERELEMAEAKFNRKREIGQILQTLATASSDILRSAISMLDLLEQDSPLYPFYIKDTMDNLEKLRNFGNESLTQLAKRENMAVPQLGEEWKWIPLRALYKRPKNNTAAISNV